MGADGPSLERLEHDVAEWAVAEERVITPYCVPWIQSACSRIAVALCARPAIRFARYSLQRDRHFIRQSH
ncbi:hypothetical protein NDU88_010106 [Pleurodeles waltl]|uniref:Uncharacterized protein n=1 Tax=Pleurodeles waltl TaxID=8319 RepID=A0AAV7QTE9_PLEWA|nr:hypothetical protein NDU88_010106 [Pleurodeles waltl]